MSQKIQHTVQLRALRQRIGRNIHDLRLKRKPTLEKLSRLSGLHPDTLDRLEMGKNEIGLDHIVRLAAAFKIAPGVFL